MQETIAKNFNFTVFIGRFQPIHCGHIQTIRMALSQSDKLIMVIGSYKSAPSTRQPWDAKQRIAMIKKCLTQEERKKVFFIPIRDRIYSEFAWNQNIIYEVLNLVPKRMDFAVDPGLRRDRNDEMKIALIGHNKDSSSY